MQVCSNRARDPKVLSVATSPFRQMVDRRLAIAQMGLAEARRHFAAGQAEDAGIVLDKIDEDLHLLRRRLVRETETRSATLHGCAN